MHMIKTASTWFLPCQNYAEVGLRIHVRGFCHNLVYSLSCFLHSSHYGTLSLVSEFLFQALDKRRCSVQMMVGVLESLAACWPNVISHLKLVSRLREFSFKYAEVIPPCSIHFESFVAWLIYTLILFCFSLKA